MASPCVMSQRRSHRVYPLPVLMLTAEATAYLPAVTRITESEADYQYRVDHVAATDR